MKYRYMLVFDDGFCKINDNKKNNLVVIKGKMTKDRLFMLVLLEYNVIPFVVLVNIALY